MKRLLAYLFLVLILGSVSTPSFTYAVSKKYWGKGDLKVSKDMADLLEYYFSRGRLGRYGKKQKQNFVPYFFIISPDGKHYEWFFNTHGGDVDNVNYAGWALSRCKKESGQECFVFADGYKIVWQNGINKKRRLSQKEIKAGKTLEILQELGFYGESKITKKTTTTSSDIADQLREIKTLYDEGVLTKEEFEKAKKKILN